MRNQAPLVESRRTVLLLLLTFATTSLHDLLVGRTIGHQAFLELGIAPWTMFVPAAVAIGLQMFLFRDSPIHIHRLRGWPAWLPISYLCLTLLCGLTALLAFALPEHARLCSGLANLWTTLWTLSLFWLYSRVGEDDFRRVGLPLGDRTHAFRLALSVVAFLLVQAALNLLVGLCLHVDVPRATGGQGLLVRPRRVWLAVLGADRGTDTARSRLACDAARGC